MWPTNNKPNTQRITSFPLCQELVKISTFFNKISVGARCSKFPCHFAHSFPCQHCPRHWLPSDSISSFCQTQIRRYFPTLSSGNTKKIPFTKLYILFPTGVKSPVHTHFHDGLISDRYFDHILPGGLGHHILLTLALVLILFSVKGNSQSSRLQSSPKKIWNII